MNRKIGPKMPLLKQIDNVLERVRDMPPGPHRDDLRQLAAGLIKIHKVGVRANVRFVEQPDNDPHT